WSQSNPSHPSLIPFQPVPSWFSPSPTRPIPVWSQSNPSHPTLVPVQPIPSQFDPIPTRLILV
ncbi:unnamed protein product, partial [Bubo scandiacus]